MSKWQFTKGLHEIGHGHHAYLQPDGGWGWSNAGLIVDGDENLLVDTLFDLKLTREMLDTMRDAVPSAREIKKLVNTHANGDHTFGNQLVAKAEIIAAELTKEEMIERPPTFIEDLVKNHAKLGEGGAFFFEMIGKNFRFDDIIWTLPTKTFDEKMNLKVGDKDVELLRVGPAHTKGDTLIYVPKDRVVYAGDVLFVGGHPVIWAGPVERWIKACDIILGWDADVIVPGHGPIATKDDVRSFKGYLEYIRNEAKKRFDAGLSAFDAACEISLEPYADWIDRERIVINVAALYSQFGKTAMPAGIDLWGGMARYHTKFCPSCAAAGHFRAH